MTIQNHDDFGVASTEPSETLEESRFRRREGAGEFVPFPSEHLPGPLRELVEAGARSMQTDGCMIALPLLAASAAMIGTSHKLRLKQGWDVAAVVWCVIVATSGSSKSVGWRLAMQPLHEIERELKEQHHKALASHGALMSEWREQCQQWDESNGPKPDQPSEPRESRIYLEDATIEAAVDLLDDNPRGLLTSVDELAAWLEGMGRYSSGKSSGEVAKWLQLFNAQPLRYDRKSGDKRTIYIPIAATSIAGTIQPGTLARLIGQKNIENGLLARFLVASPPARTKQWTEDGVQYELVSAVRDVFLRLLELDFDLDRRQRRVPVVVSMHDEAKRLWVDHFNSHNAALPKQDEALLAAYSKLEETPARLALILHLTRFAAGESVCRSRLDVDSMRAGIALTEWFKREVHRTYALMRRPRADEAQEKLIDWIESKGGCVTARDVQQGRREFRKVEQADAALDRLRDAGYGDWLDAPPGPDGGRPTRCFRLSA